MRAIKAIFFPINYTSLIVIAVFYFVASLANARTLTKADFKTLEKGSKAQIQKLLSEPGIANAADESGLTLLMDAAMSGKTEVVKTLIAQKADLKKTYKNGDSALVFAIANDQTEAALELVKAGASVKGTLADRSSNTLFMAAINQNTVLPKAMVEKDKTVLEDLNGNGETPLMRVAKNGTARQAKLLLSMGASAMAKNSAGLTALEISKQNENEEVTEILSNTGTR